MNILLYPIFSDRMSITDHFYRLHWYLYPFRDKINSLTLPHTLEADPVGAVPDYLDPQLANLKGQIQALNLVKVTSDAQLEDMIKAADVILLSNIDPSQPDNIPDSPFKTLIKKKKCLRVDHDAERFAGSFYLMFAEQFPDEVKNSVSASKEIFGRIKKRCVSQKGYIFGTGPGLALVKDHDFSDGISIACNSMVRNRELLDRLQPPLIVIGDPIFHAGPSRYAATFRKELIEALDRYNSYLIVPLRDYHVYKAHLPKRFHDRMAAIPYKKGAEPNLDLTRNYHVTTTANILTLFLLPLASTFFKEITIAGCDGRPLEDDGYFWGHDKASQFNDEMQSIRDAHPAFFAINYNEYYLEHCATLKKWLNITEKRQKKISNVTPSFIPALRELFEDPLATSNEVAEVIILDPDALDHFGHYLAFDDKLHDACQAKGLAFSIFGHINCASDIVDARPWFEPVFSIHSWTIGNRPKGPKASDIDRFTNELRKALKLRREKGLKRKTVIYMYCGSLPIAMAVQQVLSEFDNISATICLFWLSFLDYKNPSYVAQWKNFLQSKDQRNKVHVTVPTRQLARGVMEAFGVELPVAPHASTTFSDHDAAGLFQKSLTDSSIKRDKKIRILFPGGMRQEKGFEITAKTVNRLTKDHKDKFQCIVRAYVTKSTPSPMAKLASTLNKSGATISNQHLDDAGFSKFLSQGDIIVLPYQAPDFSERTSGLLIDALYLGIPVIVWDNTWLADAVAEYKNGIIVKGTRSEGLVDALLKISGQYDTYRSAAQKAQNEYFRTNSWEKLLDSIVSNPVAQEILESQLPKSSTDSASSIVTYNREEKATLDETDVVAQLYKSFLTGSLMIDVGAHHGSALSPFKRMGWDIFAFEPDPKNRDYLVKHHGKAKNVLIDQRAVGEKVESGKAFYSSKESTGISGMLAFRDTHKAVTTVDVTTVAEIIKEHNIDHIDFLKIDVEGYDFGVLKGVPWDRIKPDIIECEFEDEKTKLLGHTWRDICDYLVERGYIVYVSEWHPIIRYGIRHDWFGLKKFPCELEDEKAWGNLLAFKTDPGAAALDVALQKVLKVKHPEHAAEPVAGAKPSGASRPKAQAQAEGPKQSEGVANSKPRKLMQMTTPQSPSPIYYAPDLTAYARFAEWLKAKNSGLFRLGQFAMWGLRFLKRHALIAFIGLTVLAALVAVPFIYPPLAPYGLYFWIAAGLLLTFATATLGAAFGNIMMQKAADREYFARQSLKAELLRELRNQTNADNKDRQRIAQEVKQMGAHLTTAAQAREKLNNSVVGAQAQVGKLEAQLSNMRKGGTSEIKETRAEIEAVRATADKLERQIKKEAQKNSNAFMQAQEQLEERLEAKLSNVRKGGTSEIKETRAEIEAVRAMADKLDEQIRREAQRNSTSFMQAQEQLEERIGAQLSEVRKGGTSEIKTRTEELRAKLEELSGSQQKTEETSKILARRHNRLAVSAPVFNYGDYQSFNRKLTKEHVQIIQDEWQRKLSIKTTPKSLAYLAHRICNLESTLRGRLATTVEDAVLRVLVAASAKSNKLKVLEIGTLFGTGLAMIHDHTRHQFDSVHLTAIDPLEGYYDKNTRDIITNEAVNEAIFRENLVTAGVPESDYTLIRGMSTDDAAIEAAAKSSYEMLIIDGDHSYAGVKSDFINFAPFVKRGGYIIFDDYGSSDWPDVKEFVDTSVLNHPDVVFVGASWRTAVFRVVKKIKA